MDMMEISLQLGGELSCMLRGFHIIRGSSVERQMEGVYHKALGCSNCGN